MSGKPEISKSARTPSKAPSKTPSKTTERRPRRSKSVVAAADSSVEQAMGGPVQDETREQWVELFPHGISIGSSVGRPVLILKDKSGTEVLPVWMQALDAGVAMAELSHNSNSTPHAVTRRLLEALDLELESCAFVELIGHHQFVNLTLRSSHQGKDENEGQAQVKTLRVRADEAMSFCLQGQARFFSTRDFMARCRALDVDLSKLEQSLVHGQLPQLTTEIEISSKKHPYVM